MKKSMTSSFSSSSSPEGCTVSEWLPGPIPRDVQNALSRLRRTEDLVHLAVMPDVHLSKDVCIGCVLATRTRIYPGAVGGDLGCGVFALPFGPTSSGGGGPGRAAQCILRDPGLSSRLLEDLAQAIPSIRRKRAVEGQEISELFSRRLSHPSLDREKERNGRVQLGTLGRGNHFLELQTDEEQRLWVMIHSGSRSIGPVIRDRHLREAPVSKTGLPFLAVESASGRDYLDDLAWALDYARMNRRVMAEAVEGILRRRLDLEADWRSGFDCHHNFVRQELHREESLWVHRKGALSARSGELGIIPGSMGTPSFHVVGRGETSSLCSSSHGAGRAMSRTEARRGIRARDFRRQMKGVHFDEKAEATLLEEAPGAYKEIGRVMRAQRDLVRTVRRLDPLLNYRAASRPRGFRKERS